MNTKPIIDKRKPIHLFEIEKEVQDRVPYKDLTFKLKMPLKKYIRTEKGFKVYQVNGEWIRNNISIMFGHGGNGYVHEFIPKDEIWVGTNHFFDCGCKNVFNDKEMSKDYIESTIKHEIFERIEMGKGTNYFIAHDLATQEEVRLGLLKDPLGENV